VGDDPPANASHAVDKVTDQTKTVTDSSDGSSVIDSPIHFLLRNAICVPLTMDPRQRHTVCILDQRIGSGLSSPRQKFHQPKQMLPLNLLLMFLVLTGVSWVQAGHQMLEEPATFVWLMQV